MTAIHQLQDIGQGRKLGIRSIVGEKRRMCWAICSVLKSSRIEGSSIRSRNLPAHVANTFTYHANHDLSLLIAVLQSPASHAESAKVACELHDVF